ncbi:MAG TPA: pitrilysin family protein [Lacipirellulaceae bacterium]|nr:pitrilysin family protein [Lacipirellulaceae bacterium]
MSTNGEMAEILSHKLDNGMVLIGEPTQAVESAAFTFLAPAGCCYDPPGRAGLAALTGEMMLRGAGPRDSRAWISDLENLGVERGESVGVAQSTYHGATLRDNLYAAIGLFADMLRRPHLPADQLEAGRSTCLQELRAIDDEPSHKLMIELRRREYPDPWGRSSHGEEASLRATTIEDVRQFHGQQYRPGNTILAVAGNFDWRRLCDEVEQLFGDWEALDVAEPSARDGRPPGHHIPFPSNQSHVGIAYPTIPYKHPDYFQAWASVGVLSSGSSSRLFTEVRERRGLCYTVYASLHTQRDRASVLCYAGTTAERAQETLDVTVAELRRLERGIEQSELDRLKARIKSSLIMQQESTSSRSGALARDWYHLGRARTLDEVGALVDALSAETINAFLEQNPPRDLLVVTLGPEPLEMPDGVST